jgi:hypothetical protein
MSVEDARFISRQVSTSATANNVAYETADAYTQAEWEAARTLGYTREQLRDVTDARLLPGRSIVAMAAVTGASKRFGQTFADHMQRVTYNDADSSVQTSTLVSDPQGNVYVVRFTYGSYDLQASKDSIMTATPLGHQYYNLAASSPVLSEAERQAAQAKVLGSRVKGFLADDGTFGTIDAAIAGNAFGASGWTKKM